MSQKPSQAVDKEGSRLQRQLNEKKKLNDEDDDAEQDEAVVGQTSRNGKETKWSLMRKLRRSSSHFTDSLRMLRIKEQEGNRRASLSPERVIMPS